MARSNGYGALNASFYGVITKSSKSSSHGGTTRPLSTAAPYGELTFVLSLLGLLGTLSVALLDARVFHHALRHPEHRHYPYCDSASDFSSDSGDSTYLSVSRSGTAPSTALSHMKRSGKVKKKKKLAHRSPGDNRLNVSLDSSAYAAFGEPINLEVTAHH